MAVLLTAALPLRASIVYSCDFEDPTENAQWQLNPGPRGPQCVNKWLLGRPGNFSATGQTGLFVSSDSINPVYEQQTQVQNGAVTTVPMYTVAYRELTLPVGNYTLDFDWRALTKGNTSLMVAWVPAATGTNSNSSGTTPAWATNYQLGSAFRGSRLWTSARVSLTITSSNAHGKLVFLWQQTKDDAPQPPSACVDNIVIADAANCVAPGNLKYTTNTATLSWTGRSGNYEVRDYCANDGSVIEYSNITSNSLVMNLQSEGTHMFLVRSVCGDGEYSQWVSTSTFVWIPGQRCVDYLDIGTSNSNQGRCYVGDFDTFIKNNQQGTVGMVDDGPSASTSMHTIHTNMNEVDPNTTKGTGLNTVPDGEIASVRLGAYTSSGNSARIEYKYTVQPGVSDLLDLKYAVVMMSGGHGENWQTDGDQQPSFRLDVLDGRGQPIASTCAHLDFKVGFGATQRWHWEDDGITAWSDWQTVTVALRPYVGQTLTIRLTSIRCSYDTHYAYAYFAIGCRGGGLEGIACGDFATDHFTAPDGFTYRWYLENDPLHTTLSTEQTFEIDPTNSSTYIVECHDLITPSCYYELVANPNPRFPYAQVTYKDHVGDCQNIVDFTNTSFIRMVDRATGLPVAGTDAEPISEVLIDFGDGTPAQMMGKTATHIYPSSGGDYTVTVVASMNGGMCEDSLSYTISLPDILHTGSADTTHLCMSDYYVIPNTTDTVHHDTVYTTYAANMYGCDAPFDHYVVFHPVSYDSTVVDLCEGGYVDFEGKRYTESGRYTVNLKTPYGCDSILELMLTIVPRLAIQAPDTITICADDEFIHVPYSILKGHVSNVLVKTDDLAKQRGFQDEYVYVPDSDIVIPTPNHLHPGYYKLTLDLGTPDCPTDPTTVVLKVRYSSEILDQKNDIVALLNSDYNGGYSWLSYQWFRNDIPVIGANSSYIVVSDNDQNAEYYCLMLSTDGTYVESCPIIYTSARTPLDNIEETFVVSPTVLLPRELLTVSAGGFVAVYDALGRLVTSHYSDSAQPLTFPAPSQAGVYLVVLNNRDSVRILVK